MERSLSYVNLSILKKQTRDMRNNNNNTVLTTLVCKLNFFIYTKFHTEVQPNLTKLVCKILMW